jgi:hypothetical protein
MSTVAKKAMLIECRKLTPRLGPGLISQLENYLGRIFEAIGCSCATGWEKTWLNIRAVAPAGWP